MTGRSIPYVVCDYEDTTTCWNHAPERHPATMGEVGTPYAEIRRVLRGQGWTRRGPLDACPACTRTDAAALRAGEGARA